MNWEAIGAIGELIGAFGVIATLLYLSVQIRQNSKNIRTSTRQEVSKSAMELGFLIAKDPEIRRSAKNIYFDDPDSVSDDDFSETMAFRAALRFFENTYHHHLDGTFADEVWHGYRENMLRTFKTKRAKAKWESVKILHGRDFVNFVETDLIPNANTNTNKNN